MLNRGVRPHDKANGVLVQELTPLLGLVQEICNGRSIKDGLMLSRPSLNLNTLFALTSWHHLWDLVHKYVSENTHHERDTLATLSSFHTSTLQEMNEKVEKLTSRDKRVLNTTASQKVINKGNAPNDQNKLALNAAQHTSQAPA